MQGPGSAAPAAGSGGEWASPARILLLQPPVQDFYDTPQRLQPLGLCYLKAALARHLPECAVVVRDYHAVGGRRTVALPPELAYLRDYFPTPDRSPFSTFYAYSHFGTPILEVARDVVAWQPDLVGISLAFTPYYREALACAEAIKAQRPVPVVVGGSHASAVPEAVLAHPAVDYVVRGEGERPLVELVRTLRAGGDLARVPNLGWRRGGRARLNPVQPNYALDELPQPDFSDLPLQRYRFGKRPLATLLASRGCPHRCRFCSVGAVFGRGYRRRSPQQVVAEIRARYAQGYRAFDFEDDNLTLPRAEMVALCRALSEAFRPGEIVLQAMNGVDYATLDAELVQWLRRAGFSHLNLSLVSLDAALCRRLGRPHDPARFAAVVQAAHGAGMRCVGYQILGLPGESPDAMLDTLIHLARLPLLIGASPFYLPPGSPLATAAGDSGPPGWLRCRLTAMGVDRHDLVYTLFVAARVLNYLKGLPLPKPVTPLGEALGLARDRGGRGADGADVLECLLRTGVLHAVERRGWQPLPRFLNDVFRRLWDRLGWLESQNGGRILLEG